MTKQTREQIQYLFLQYLEGKASENEVKELSLFLIEEKDETWENLMEELMVTESHMENYQEKQWQPMIEELIRQHEKVEKAVPGKLRWLPRINTKVAAAAIIFLLLSVGGYFYFNKNNEKEIAGTDTQKNKNDVLPPQTNKAVLTLSDGSAIVLDTATNGTLTQQGNVDVVKTSDGQIVYKGDATEIKYNTLTVPNGSKPVRLQLADGSEVWLNVASSITYPTAFVGNERKVQITGEAYFEVAHNASLPFVVQKNDMSVQVLGTHFNVNTYDDETLMKITLLEGSVKVTKGTLSNILRPGQQAQVDAGIRVIEADVDDVMAWKNGLFSFNKVDLQTVLRQLTKWYDVVVEYRGNIPQRTFGGDMERSLSLSQVLEVLEKYEVHFKIEGKKIIVMQ